MCNISQSNEHLAESNISVINIPQKVANGSSLSKHSGNSNLEIELRLGSTTIIIGANGSGKTRLSAYIEDQLGEKAHRIAAHRALELKADLEKITEDKAKNFLKYGLDSGDLWHKQGWRWRGNASVSLLNDFDGLQKYLFAEQNNIAIKYYQDAMNGNCASAKKSKLHMLKETWESMLPHRKLEITADNIFVSLPYESDVKYLAAEMSDGERAIFYILGQVLAADENTVLIFDEPELHIHKSIISSLWDKIEELRPDCTFLVITHDIDFAATRVAQKYVIKNYYPDPAWDISEAPESTFDEQTISLILGSRKPILFVEGNDSSLDIAIYRYCYPEWTIIPKGSCKDVIQSVSSLKKLVEDMPLLNLTCAGIVDQDSREEDEVAYLSNLGIKVLPVSEIENIFSLTDVAKEILILNNYKGQDLIEKLSSYKTELIEFIKNELSGDKLDYFIVRAIQRKIDNDLKKIVFSNLKNSEEMKKELLNNIKELANQKLDLWIQKLRTEISNLLERNDLDGLLKIYDNKGLLAKSSSLLEKGRRNEFESWIMRHFKNSEGSEFMKKVREKLPNI